MMSDALMIEGLCKAYPDFYLEGVSFSVKRGEIMGFIGRNGAGKTTTLKSLLNLVHPDSGNITFFGAPFLEKEQEIKKRIGVAMGGVGYYLRKKIREIAVAAKVFYPNWDDPSYWKYLERFSLDQEKRLVELSEGMKVKFSLALALSIRPSCWFWTSLPVVLIRFPERNCWKFFWSFLRRGLQSYFLPILPRT